MFSYDNPNLIVSDEGFSVQVLGRTGLRYQQGERWLCVDSEVLAGPHGLVIYPSSVKSWEPVHQPVSDGDKNTIVANIQRAFAFRGFEIEVS